MHTTTTTGKTIIIDRNAMANMAVRLDALSKRLSALANPQPQPQPEQATEPPAPAPASPDVVIRFTADTTQLPTPAPAQEKPSEPVKLPAPERTTVAGTPLTPVVGYDPRMPLTYELADIVGVKLKTSTPRTIAETAAWARVKLAGLKNIRGLAYKDGRMEMVCLRMAHFGDLRTFAQSLVWAFNVPLEGVRPTLAADPSGRVVRIKAGRLLCEIRSNADGVEHFRALLSL